MLVNWITSKILGETGLLDSYLSLNAEMNCTVRDHTQKWFALHVYKPKHKKFLRKINIHRLGRKTLIKVCNIKRESM